MANTSKLSAKAQLYPVAAASPLLLAIIAVSFNPQFESNPGIHWLVQFVAGALAAYGGVLVLRRKPELTGNGLTLAGAGLLGAGVLDMCYGLSVMPGAGYEQQVGIVPWGWYPSRVLLPIAFIVGMVVWRFEIRHRDVSRPTLLTIRTLVHVATAAGCLFIVLAPSDLPQAYYPEFVLHRPYELIPAALFAVAFWALFASGEWQRNILSYNMLLALATSVATHTLLMSFAANNFDNFFAAAVLAKLVSYAFVVLGLVLESRDDIKQEARDREIRHKAIVDTAGDGILTFDSAGIIDSFNPAAEELFGYTPDEVIGQSIALLVAGDLAEEHAHYRRHAQVTKRTMIRSHSHEIVGRRKDGTTFPMEYAVNEVKLDDTWLFTAILRDITERKRKQKELEDLSQRLAVAMESAGQGSWEQDLQRGTVSWDRQMFKLYGMEGAQESPSVEDWLKMVHPDDVEACLRAQQNTRVYRQPFELEFRIIRPDGAVRWIRTAGKPVEGDGAAPTRIVGINRDVSARKQYQDELLVARAAADEANRAKSAFLATMSHEIRTPLNGVIGMAEVLQTTELQAYQAEMAGLIRQSGTSLMAILEDILDFSKIEAGRLELDPTPIDIAGVVEEVCAVQKSLAQKNKVELTLFTDPDIPGRVIGDGQRLRQILANLANNALKFSAQQGRRGRVTVRAELARQAGDEVLVEFRVIDNGIGIEPAAQEQLFDAFTQADASTSRKFGGSGLGLTISRRLAELMGGEIGVSSRPGEGSTFTVRLPFSAHPASAVAGDRGVELDGMSCVLLTASDTAAADLSAYLAHAGASVHRVRSLAALRQPGIGGTVDERVWIVDAGDGEITPAEVKQALRAHPMAVAICRQSSTLALLDAAGVRTVDGIAMSRSTFLDAVAATSGPSVRQAPADSATRAKAPALSLPSRDEAIAQGRLILVAEDNETNQKVIQNQLALLGFRAEIAGDGFEALNQWRSGDYALLVTDLEMPTMDGYQLAATIRAEERGLGRMPIVALTANILTEKAEQCAAAGMDAFLSKPASLDDLSKVLGVWLPASKGVASFPAEVEAPDDRAVGSACAPPIDVDVLMGLVGGNESLVSGFLQSFPREAGPMMTEIRSAFESGQSERAAAAAHKLKSSAVTVGANRLGTICASLEKMARSGAIDSPGELIALLETELVAVEEFLPAIS